MKEVYLIPRQKQIRGTRFAYEIRSENILNALNSRLNEIVYRNYHYH